MRFIAYAVFPLSLCHLYKSGRSSRLLRSDDLFPDIPLAHAGVAVPDVGGGKGLGEDARDDHAGHDVVEAVGRGAQELRRYPPP